MKRVALGFSVHTGWAQLVVLGEAGVLGRARLEMIPGHDADKPPFVYHAARELDLTDAERFIERFAARARETAEKAIAPITREHGATVAGVIVGHTPLDVSLEKILASHTLVHAAEGHLYRDAIRQACEAAGLEVVAVPARSLPAGARVDARLAEIGRAAGRPWAKDHKLACLAALAALSDN